MWEWSRSVAERAAAASWTGRWVDRTEPSITDPECWLIEPDDEMSERLARADDFALAS